jgi:hypothetical protein
MIRSWNVNNITDDIDISHHVAHHVNPEIFQIITQNDTTKIWQTESKTLFYPNALLKWELECLQATNEFLSSVGTK